MAESPEDETRDDGSGDDSPPPPAETELAAAVDDAMKFEIKRQKARFVQQIMGLDRIEGVGRRGELWDRDLGADQPDDSKD